MSALPRSFSAGLPEARQWILVLDDDDLVRIALKRVLTASGYQVQSASTGTEALAMMAEQRFDLMFCDVRLDGESGVELLPVFHEQAPDMPIVMVSGVDSDEFTSGALLGGAVDYLVKPVPRAQLLEVAHAVLEGRHDRGSVTRARGEEIPLDHRQQVIGLQQPRVLTVAITPVESVQLRQVARRRRQPTRSLELKQWLADQPWVPGLFRTRWGMQTWWTAERP
ncbi:MAG: two-component response regulator [Gemmatimonadetes bacterium]|nr:two-component response regulator [Gemmatimonadota bacterium]